MSFVKTIKALFPGYGQATSYGSTTNVATNASSNTAITLSTASTASATVVPLVKALHQGKIRVRTNVIGVNATSGIVSITATDGTTTLSIYGGDKANTSAGIGLDETIDFCTNLQLNSFTVTVNVVTNNCTHDVEIAGN